MKLKKLIKICESYSGKNHEVYYNIDKRCFECAEFCYRGVVYHDGEDCSEYIHTGRYDDVFASRFVSVDYVISMWKKSQNKKETEDFFEVLMGLKLETFLHAYLLHVGYYKYGTEEVKNLVENPGILTKLLVCGDVTYQKIEYEKPARETGIVFLKDTMLECVLESNLGLEYLEDICKVKDKDEKERTSEVLFLFNEKYVWYTQLIAWMHSDNRYIGFDEGSRYFAKEDLLKRKNVMTHQKGDKKYIIIPVEIEGELNYFVFDEKKQTGRRVSLDELKINQVVLGEHVRVVIEALCNVNNDFVCTYRGNEIKTWVYNNEIKDVFENAGIYCRENIYDMVDGKAEGEFVGVANFVQEVDYSNDLLWTSLIFCGPNNQPMISFDKETFKYVREIVSKEKFTQEQEFVDAQPTVLIISDYKTPGTEFYEYEIATGVGYIFVLFDSKYELYNRENDIEVRGKKLSACQTIAIDIVEDGKEKELFLYF